MSRQGSRTDKKTLTRETKKRSRSCLATSESTRVIMRNETAKLPSPEIQKCVAVKDTSLVKPLVKSCMNKRASVTESIDTAPLHCKSVSAQNLAIDNNFLNPASTRVQKSYSFTEMYRDPYPISSIINMKNTSDVFKTSLEDKSLDKAPGKKEQPTDLNMSNQKQVSEQEILTPKLTSHPTLLYVCPWEFASSLPSSCPTVAKRESSLDLGVEALRSKPSISASAPGSPYTFAKPMARCGFSFHSTTQTVLLARSLVAKKGNGKYISKNELSKEEGTLQQTRSVTLSSAIKSVKKTPQTPIRSMACTNSKPCLVKQAAIRQSPERTFKSNVPHIHLWESKDMKYENIIQGQALSIKSTEPSWQQDSLTVPRSTVCKWNVPNRTCQQSSIADICPWEVQQQEQLQLKRFNVTDGLTWEADNKQMQITTGNKSVCRQESQGKVLRMNSNSKDKTEEHQSHTEAGVLHGNIKQDFAKSVSGATKPTERVIYVNAHPGTKKQSLVKRDIPRTDVCPWETSDTHTNQEIMSVDVYPWKLNDIGGKYSDTMRNTDLKGITTDSPRHHLTKKFTSVAAMEICPWDFPEEFSCQWKSENPPITNEKPKGKVKKTISLPDSLPKQLTSTAETCPWDFPESSPIVKEVSLLETEKVSLQSKQEEKDMGFASQISTINKTDSYSQEAEASERAEGITITKEADTPDLQKESVHAKICLWENISEESKQLIKSPQKQLTPNVTIDVLHTGKSVKQVQNNETAVANICSWEREQSPKAAESQNDLQARICPSKVEVSETSTIQAGVCVEFSTGETDSEQPTYTKNSISEKTDKDFSTHTAQGARAYRPLTRCDALCPWEIKGRSRAFSTEPNNSDIFTWEEPIAEEESDAETAAEAFIFPPDL